MSLQFTDNTDVDKFTYIYITYMYITYMYITYMYIHMSHNCVCFLVDPLPSAVLSTCHTGREDGKVPWMQ